MKPKIIIVSEEGYSKNIPHFMIPCDYGTAIGKAGGLPLVALDATHPQSYAEMGDGLLLTGGNDIHCGRYNEVYQNESDTPAFSPHREVLEFELCRLFLQAGKPIFGIGRGMQVLNVALGGTLHRHIENHRHTDENGVHHFCQHPITVDPSCRLSSVLQDNMTVNSCHHQAVKALGTGLVTAATATVIEAVEHTSLPVFGVQWHPQHETNGSALFDLFVSLCKEAAQ